MKILFLVALSICTSLNVLATAQTPDKIIYNGQEYALYSNPLEEFFYKSPDKRPKGYMRSTALWRGYIATFEIRDSQFYLKDIVVSDSATIWKSVVKEIFPNQTEIKVDWVTGLLVIPYGKLISYVHMGYGSTYENYILLEIDKGDFKRGKNLKYEEYEKFKERQFEAFKQTDEYKKLKEGLKKDGRTDEFINSFLRRFATNYTTKILTD